MADNITSGNFLGGFARGSQRERGLALDQRQADRADRAQTFAERLAAQSAESETRLQIITGINTRLNATLEAARSAVSQIDESGGTRTAEQTAKLIAPLKQSALQIAQAAQANNLPVDVDLVRRQFDLLASRPNPTTIAAGKASTDVAGQSAKEKALIAAGLTPEQARQSAFDLDAPDTGGPFEGTGFQATASNVLVNLADRMQRGAPLSAAEKRAYSIAYGELTAPKIVGSPTTGFSVVQQTLDASLFPHPDGAQGAPPAPEGSSPPAPQPAAPDAQTGGQGGMTVTEIGGPQRQPPERAGRIALVKQAAQTARTVREKIVRPDQSVDRSLLLSMIVDVPGMGKGLPGSEGRTLRAQFEDAASAKLRLETGAQANESEIQGIVDRFLPSMFDSDETVRDKMERLTEFFDTALKETDPALFDSLTGRAGGEPEPPDDEPKAVFRGYDLDSGYAVFERPDKTFFAVPR